MVCEHKSFKTYTWNDDIPDPDVGEYNILAMTNDDLKFSICDDCKYIAYNCMLCNHHKQIILIARGHAFHDVFENMPEVPYKLHKNYIASDSDMIGDYPANSWSAPFRGLPGYEYFTNSNNSKNLEELIVCCSNCNNAPFADITDLNIIWLHPYTRLTGEDGGKYFIMKCNNCGCYSYDQDK